MHGLAWEEWRECKKACLHTKILLINQGEYGVFPNHFFQKYVENKDFFGALSCENPSNLLTYLSLFLFDQTIILNLFFL